MNLVMSIGKFKTKREAVEEGLKLLAKLQSQAEIRDFRGALKWDGKLDSSVWVNYFNGAKNQETDALDSLFHLPEGRPFSLLFWNYF